MQPGGYYAQTQFVSNSTLKDLNKMLYGGFEIANLQKIYNMGSLIDAHLTEKSEVAKYEQLVDESDRKKAVLMKQAGEADPALKLLLSTCQTQHEVYRNAFKFTWEGWQLELPVRIKIDFRRKGVLIGDLKSTAEMNPDKFKDAIYFFDYDQQAALYLDAENTCDKFLFTGISKTANRKGKHAVMKYAVQRGDDMYLSGKRKYSFLMYKYYWLVHRLNFKNEKVFQNSMDCVFD